MADITPEQREQALKQFTEYFVRNYPGPDTLIHKPEWHAPKLFNAALHAIKTALSAAPQPVAVPDGWEGFLGKLETWCCELPDRTSPEDAPEMMLIDQSELHMLAEKVRDFVLAAPTPPASDVSGSPLLEWAVEQWRRQVGGRPLRNVHRRSLDDVWRQVIRWAGGCPEALIGPSHDALLEAAPPAGGDQAAEETVTIDGREYRKFIRYPEEVGDGTLRCISCGQIDEEPYHNEALCPALQR